jgi:hypothetical protein
MHKIAIVIYSKLEGSGESSVYRALMFARELIEAGDDVAIVFDGGGTTAHAAIIDSTHPLHRTFTHARPAVRGSCAYCAKSYGVDEILRHAGETLMNDDRGHASLRSLLDEGRQIVTF